MILNGQELKEIARLANECKETSKGHPDTIALMERIEKKAMEALKEYEMPAKMQDVLFKVAETELGVSKDDVIRLRSHRRQPFNIRCAIAVILRRTMTLHEVANVINRDHSSVVYCVNKHRELYGWDKDYTRIYDKLSDAVLEFNCE